MKITIWSVESQFQILSSRQNLKALKINCVCWFLRLLSLNQAKTCAQVLAFNTQTASDYFGLTII